MEIACDMILECAAKLRSDAKRLMEEKELLVKHIEQVRNTVKSSNLSRAQHDDAICNVERALQLSETVEVAVCNMVRDSAQSEARKRVAILLEKLEQCMIGDPRGAKIRVISYINACNSSQVGHGIPPDQEFEKLLVSCTLDDQKEARKRIQRLIENFNINI